MEVHWLIEKNVFEDTITQNFVAAIEKQNMVVKQAEYVPFAGHALDLNYFGDDDCVVFHGSLNLAAVLSRYTKWIPGVYYTVDNYRCSTYYNYFGKYHVNNDYIMLPFGELDRQHHFLFSKLGKENTIFVRPDSGSKQFTGQTMSLETWKADLDLIGFYDVEDTEMVVVSSPKNIKAEYRFVVVGDEIITGCQYNAAGKYVEEAMDVGFYSSHAVVLKINEILEGTTWRPDKVFVMDMCQVSSGECYLLEIGCFSCAGLYACDLDMIVQEVSTLAFIEHKEYQDIC